MKQFARDNLCYLGGLIPKGDELPPGVPAHLLDHWRELGAIGPVPVVEEPAPADVPADVPAPDAAERPREAGAGTGEPAAPATPPAPKGPKKK